MDSYTIDTLKQDDFEYIKNIVWKESGIHLSEMKKALVQSRLLRRMRELGIKHYHDYCEYIRNNYHQEIENLINCITTNKTEFFREYEHFVILRHLVEHELSHSNLSIWSAGCSTGEEAYSIAIVMHESNFKKQFSILATDIDTRVLEVAKNGMYPLASVEHLDIAILKKYFLKGKDKYQGLAKVKEFLKENITFQRLNLMDVSYNVKGYFHIIFCRNVLIYFDKDVQNYILKKFYEYLQKGGYLFLGYAESLIHSTLPFRYIAHSVYQKC